MDRERAPLTEEEERLQDLRENRSSPRVLKLFFTVGKKERNSLSPSLISRATRPLLFNIPVHTERLENESSSLELNRNFPSLPVIRNIFPSFPPLLRDYYYQSVEITEPSNATGFDIHVVHARVFNYDSDRN